MNVPIAQKHGNLVNRKFHPKPGLSPWPVIADKQIFQGIKRNDRGIMLLFELHGLMVFSAMNVENGGIFS